MCGQGREPYFVGQGEHRRGQIARQRGRMPQGIRQWHEPTTRPEQRAGIESAQVERVVVDPATGGGVSIQEDLIAPVEKVPFGVAIGANAPTDAICRLEDVHGNTGFVQSHGRDQAGHASTDDDDGEAIGSMLVVRQLARCHGNCHRN